MVTMENISRVLTIAFCLVAIVLGCVWNCADADTSIELQSYLIVVGCVNLAGIINTILNDLKYLSSFGLNGLIGCLQVVLVFFLFAWDIAGISFYVKAKSDHTCENSQLLPSVIGFAVIGLFGFVCTLVEYWKVWWSDSFAELREFLAREIPCCCWCCDLRPTFSCTGDV